MKMEPRDFFQVGERLLDNASCEADHRSSIGRFYYAAYHHGIGFEKQLPSSGHAAKDNAGGTHAQLIHRLTHPSVASGDPSYTKSKQLGYILNAMRPLRIRSDYLLDEKVDVKDAYNSRQHAINVLKI